MRRRAGPLVVGVVVGVLGLFFLLGARTVAGEAEAGVGPRAFPTLIGAGLVVLGLVFVFAVRGGMEFPAAAEPPAARGVLPWLLAGLVGGILAIEPLGFPVAAAWLFVMGARGFGSRRWAHNAVLGVVMGVVVYLVFARALGVSLPGGLIDRVWPRG